MMKANDSRNLKPTQVLVSDADRDLGRRIQERSMALEAEIPGPTTLYRAGLSALEASDDDLFLRCFDRAEERLDMDALTKMFDEWCIRIGDTIARTEPELEDAHDVRHFSNTGKNDSDVRSCMGNFANNGRSVMLSLMQDGIVLISGMQVIVESAQLERAMPHTSKLFSGDIAAMISINAEGAALAQRAITAWLLMRDGEIDDIWRDISVHRKQKLR